MSTKTEKEAEELHDQVLSETKWMLYHWLVVVSVNFLAHFMRMGISLSYMTHELGASELSAGAVVTIHMALIGLANAYLSFSMDTHSFETMVTARFGLLVLVTLAEWLAQDFIQFAIAYIIASLSIIWIAVADGYFVQLLPADEAKKMTTYAGLLNRVATLAGLAFGGCIAGLVSFNAVFLGSFIISLMSLMYILVFVLGKEAKIKQAQSEKVKQVYMDHPGLMPVQQRFPMPFAAELDDGGMEEHKVIEAETQTKSESVFCSLSGIPLAMYIVFIGLLTAEKLEIMAWWNVYAMQVMDQSIALSNAQMILAVACAVIALSVSVPLIKAHSMDVDTLLDWSIVAFPLVELATALGFILILPSLGFAWFWLAYPVIYIIDAIPAPLRYAIQVIESPADQSGSVFAAIILSRSLVPAMQHIIIGALWNYGGPNHPWFFRWFGILSCVSTLVFICYWLTKKWVLSRNKHTTEENHPYQIVP